MLGGGAKPPSPSKDMGPQAKECVSSNGFREDLNGSISEDLAAQDPQDQIVQDPEDQIVVKEEPQEVEEITVNTVKRSSSDNGNQAKKVKS